MSSAAITDPVEHIHTCPDCFEPWTHVDEACCEDAIPDPWHRGATSGGYAECPACAAPGSNGSEWRFCFAHGTRTLADPAGRPGCCGGPQV